MNENGRAFDWNDTIENDSSFTLLPEGEYPFVVTSFERGRHNGSAKLPECPKAVLKIKVTDPETGNSATIEHNLFLHSKTEGLLCAFFTSIGQRNHGEKLTMDWNRVPASIGRCKVYIDKWTGNDGQERESNRISAFLEPDNTPAAKPSFSPGAF